MKVFSFFLLLFVSSTMLATTARAGTPQSGARFEVGEEAEHLLDVAATIREYHRSTSSPQGSPYESSSATLEGFDMLTRDTKALLRWTTTSERNNAGFEVQYRPADSEAEFMTVGFVVGAGDSSERHLYRFGVKNLTSGEHEFRLKITSRFGATTATEPIRIDIGSRPAFALGAGAHDPETGVVYVPYTIDEAGIVRLIIEDADGNLVETLAFGSHDAGTHVAYFRASSVKGQGYTIRLHTEAGSVARSVCLECAAPDLDLP